MYQPNTAEEEHITSSGASACGPNQHQATDGFPVSLVTGDFGGSVRLDFYSPQAEPLAGGCGSSSARSNYSPCPPRFGFLWIVKGQAWDVVIGLV